MSLTEGDRRAAAPDFPEGLRDDHIAPRSAFLRHASPLSLLVLGAVIAAAFTGVLGGVAEPPALAVGEAAILTVDTPRTLRNGEFFETRVTVEAAADIGELVLTVTPSLWRDQTQNTMIPAAAEESFSDGAFRYSYGPLGAGKRFEIKIDGQINPASLGGTRGRIAILDGTREIAAIPLEVKVLP